MKKYMTSEEEEQQNNKWIQGKMRNTRKKPFTIEKTRGVYDMSSKVRGWCLIFSNHVFKHEAKLLGYERDKENFEKVFSELHFKTKIFEKVTADEMKLNIEKYANTSASNGEHPTNGLVVVILSHGMGNYLCGVNYNQEEDSDKICVGDVTEIVSNKNCAHLIGKPKIFFLQACRGDKHDLGLDVLPPKLEDNKNTTTTAVATTLRSGKQLYNELDEKVTKLPSVGEEVMIFYATPSNYASYVPLSGSLFGVQLCVELKRWAWQRDLYDIMLSVNSALREKDITIPNKRSVKQVIEFHFKSPTKKLYFNPGYCKKLLQHPPTEATKSSCNLESTPNIRSITEQTNGTNDLNQRNVLPYQETRSTSTDENDEPANKRRKQLQKDSSLPQTRKIRKKPLLKGQTFIDRYFWKQKTSTKSLK